MNNENISSGKGLTFEKTTLLSGQERVTVVTSLPTNPSCDVTANIPICLFSIFFVRYPWSITRPGHVFFGDFVLNHVLSLF